ncbi:MAG TPA: hypothetical protein VFR29_00855 [Steroidobacteraceae bacterium]|nr:hypothetical protein [Steroidobacteraceae bacterium]
MKPGASTAAAAALPEVFARLRGIMRKASAGLDVKRDTPAELYVDTRHIQKNGKPLYFGGVQVRKRYVSYHLMPVYVNPALFRELEALTRAGLADYRRRGFVQAAVPE